ncbi:hypothetical protein [Microbacterium album]|uniref:Phosphodiesterase n=1 Tax=Microbacterium album TaxID=2053191 RepID=A0A917IDV0_9MICO|nr:hypothetical protein [Microbacterium album]GGH38637.1 hypothetical protein GCM10010921_09340 [Microbacterium album]
MLAGLAGVAGTALGGFFSVLRRIRHPRPIHPHGLVLTGQATWIRDAAPSGIGWIDDARGTPVEVTARLSRGVGLPDRLPDVLGLALRLHDDDGGHADVLLASTGIGFPFRFVLVPRRSATGATFGSLLPYRSARGPVLICARSVPPRVLPADLGRLRRSLKEQPWQVRLYHAAPIDKWHPFADVVLRPAAEMDSAELRFDPVGHPLPGSTTYLWARRLRDPSYRAAQRGTSGVGRGRSPGIAGAIL